MRERTSNLQNSVSLSRLCWRVGLNIGDDAELFSVTDNIPIFSAEASGAR